MTLNSLLIALLFAVIGIGVFGCSLLVLAKLLPGQLWRQAVEERSIPAAIILAGVAIALGWIVAAAVH
jgi:putative membrane protein